MNYRILGSSDLKISEISFGCSSLERDHRQNCRLIHRAFDNGINFFDTADLYDKGWNEESVGSALREIRQEVIISTKVGNRWRPDGSGWDWTPSKDYILSAVNASLSRLRTDRIDLYQLHGGTLDDPVDEIIDAFEILQQEGKILYYGISSIRPNVIREYIARSAITSVMMQYSLLDRRPEESCLGLLREAGIPVLVRGSLAKGLLIDKPPKAYTGYPEKAVAAMQHAVQATGNPVGAALQFVLDHPAVATAVVGVRNAGQLSGVVEGYRKTVSQAVLNKVKEVLEPNIYENHR